MATEKELTQEERVYAGSQFEGADHDGGESWQLGFHVAGCAASTARNQRETDAHIQPFSFLKFSQGP